MTTATLDTFSPVELYLLSVPFDIKTIFGLPEKAVYQLKGEEIFAEGYERLMEKGIFDEKGKLTDGGGFIMEALLEYHQSKQYVRMNQFMFAFSEDRSDELLILVEVKPGEAYQFMVVDKIYALALLREQFSIITREPLEDEKSFLKQELTNTERKKAEESQPDKTFINLEFFHLDEEPREESNPKFYQQFFVYCMDNQLIMVDIGENNFYRISQYWLLKIIFDELKFPYKGER